MPRTHLARHGRRISAIGTWFATSLLFVGGFALGLGTHQAIVSSGTRRVVCAVIALAGALILIALVVEIRRERPGEHARVDR